MIITIDGPAAAGKSTVARRLAERLGFEFLDTGATYRAVTWKALQHDVDLNDPAQLRDLAHDTEIRFEKTDDVLRVLCDGRDITSEIRQPEVTRNIKYLADEPAVRDALIDIHRDFADGRDVVTEGRDQGTEVFPDADLKFYLDASAEARARRRQQDLAEAGTEKALDDVLAGIRQRDAQDRNREKGGLRCRDDMIVIDSTDLSVEQVVSRMTDEIEAKPGAPNDALDDRVKPR